MDINRLEFELRIFISFSIVITISILSFTVFSEVKINSECIGFLFGLASKTSISAGYIIVSVFMVIASFIRIWSGSVLTSSRMMKFSVQVDTLIITGPYHIVRNPIYFADLVAFIGFTICLPYIGILLPVLLCIHYIQLIRYEEKSLVSVFGESYKEYMLTVPCLIPNLRSLRNLVKAFKNIKFSGDGLRHNALYLLFIPGFIVSGLTQKLMWALIIGLPAVIDWGIIHTKIGIRDDNEKVN